MRPSHIILLIIVIVLVFGAAKLPQLAQSIVESVKILRKGAHDMDSDAEIRTNQASDTADSSQSDSSNSSL